MGIYRESLIRRKQELFNMLNKFNELDVLNNEKLLDNELRNIEFGDKKILFVETPTFDYNLTYDMLDVSQYIGNIKYIKDEIKTVVVGTLQITDDYNLQNFVNSLDNEHKRIAFYLSPNDSIYHDGRVVRLAAF